MSAVQRSATTHALLHPHISAPWVYPLILLNQSSHFSCSFISSFTKIFSFKERLNFGSWFCFALYFEEIVQILIDLLKKKIQLG